MAANAMPSGGSGGEFPKMPGVEAIRTLAEMGVKSSDITVKDVPTKGLGEGLPETVPVGWDRNNQRVLSLKESIEAFRLRPQRRTGTADMQTLASFIKLVQRHQDGDSAVFADLDWRAPKFTAVIDYHGQAVETDGEAPATHEPRWLRHRIAYAFPLSDPWKAWVEQNSVPMKQDAFAAFIEDHIAEVSAPTEAEQKEYEATFRTRIADPFEIMTLSRGLAVSVDAKVGRSILLQSGEGEIAFEEVHRDGAGQKLTVPGLFMLSVPVFFRGAHVRFPVRLRYRVANGQVVWFYQIWRPDEFVTAAVQKDLDAVRVETGLPAYEGAPEGGC